ncbi:MAG TPA: DUF3515 family protein [Actinomycetes bacterium]|nr:DUF3515 family protein [Actinomycetes bacterium]
MLGACTSPSSVDVPVPTAGARGCARLADALPGELDGRERRATEPASHRTAAWGDPPVVLRCGVPRPPGLTGSEVVVVDGVGWVLSERPAAYVFTTSDLATYVQVRVPRSTPRTAATAPLVDLAEPIETSVPRR